MNGATLEGTRVNYSSRVSISTLVPAISAAWVALPSLRLGAGFGVAITSISQTQNLSMRSDPAINDAAILRTADGTGTTWGGQGSLGLQWDVTERLVAGASLRTPTFTILRTGSLSFQDVETVNSATGPATYQSYFSDPDATFSYHLPLDVNFGLAWREPRFDVEIDVRYHSSIAEYTLLGSSQQVEKITTYPDGTQVRTKVPFAGLTYGAATVWNLAIGGRYTLDESWSLHGGFYTDAAPAAAGVSSVFRSVNLYGLTAGAKLKGEHLSGSLGLGVSWGQSDEFLLGSPGAGAVSTRLSVLTLALLYAIAYRF